MNNINFDQYDRITDTLMYLSNEITLNFTVVLARKNKSGGRTFFQFETEYGSKYIGTDTARSIKRNMNFYFIIDNKTFFAGGFILKPQDVVILLKMIEDQIIPWYFGKDTIFSLTKDGSKLIIKGDFHPIYYTQSESKYLRFDPFVYTYDDNTCKEGIRMYVNSENDWVDMDIDKFMGFYYVLKNTDMYSVASSMVNYVKTPPYGVNIFRQAGLGSGRVPQDNWNNNEPANDKANKTKHNSFLDNARSTKTKEK